MVNVDLKDAYSYGLPTHAAISNGAGTLSAHMPAFWPVLHTLGIHHSDETFDLYSDYTENKLWALTSAAITFVRFSLQHWS